AAEMATLASSGSDSTDVSTGRTMGCACVRSTRSNKLVNQPQMSPPVVPVPNLTSCPPAASAPSTSFCSASMLCAIDTSPSGTVTMNLCHCGSSVEVVNREA